MTPTNYGGGDDDDAISCPFTFFLFIFCPSPILFLLLASPGKPNLPAATPDNPPMIPTLG